MFDFKSWLKQGLIDGYASGEFSRPAVIVMTANYISKGMLTEADAAEIDAACPAPEEPDDPLLDDILSEDVAE